jgi:hypothetical protein
MIDDLNFNVGDTVVSSDKESTIFKRECVVVHADKAIVGVVTEGIAQVVFLPYDMALLRVTKKGYGYLEKEDKARLAHAMQHWGFSGFINSLPSTIDQSRKHLGFSGDDKLYVRMDGFVPKELASAWKQFMALVEMMKQTNPELPNYVNTLMFEWVLAGALTSLKFTSVFKQFLESNEDNEEKK